MARIELKLGPRGLSHRWPPTIYSTSVLSHELSARLAVRLLSIDALTKRS